MIADHFNNFAFTLENFKAKQQFHLLLKAERVVAVDMLGLAMKQPLQGAGVFRRNTELLAKKWKNKRRRNASIERRFDKQSFLPLTRLLRLSSQKFWEKIWATSRISRIVNWATTLYLVLLQTRRLHFQLEIRFKSNKKKNENEKKEERNKLVHPHQFLHLPKLFGEPLCQRKMVRLHQVIQLGRTITDLLSRVVKFSAHGLSNAHSARKRERERERWKVKEQKSVSSLTKTCHFCGESDCDRLSKVWILNGSLHKIKRTLLLFSLLMVVYMTSHGSFDHL